MFKFKRHYFSLMTAFILILSVNAYAQNNISVSAEVNPNVLTLGSSGQLMITVKGAKSISTIEAPSVPGLDIQYYGTSSQMSFTNMQKSSSVTFTYSILPTSTGKFTIPTMDVPVENQTFKTEPVSLEVVEQNKSASVSSDSSQAQSQPQPVSLKDRIFLRLQAPKTELYINERMPIKILLFINELNVADLQYPRLEPVGFKLSDWGRDQQFQQTINGLLYTILEIDAFIYPTRIGEIQLGPAQMDLNIITKAKSQNRFNSLLGDDYINAILNGPERHAYAPQSNQVTLQVKDLPQQDKPQNFSGAVGNFTYEVSASPTDIKVGDPITLKMSIQGDGDLNAVNFPVLKDNESFKVYDPAIKEENGVKKLEQVVIPKNKEVVEIPAFHFAYFNTNLQKYVTITKGPFAIHASEPETGNVPAIISSNKLEEKVAPVIQDKLGEDIVFIKESPGKIYDKGKYYYNQIWFYLFMTVLALGYGGFLMYYRMTHRLKHDQVYARRFHAPKYAKAGLELARLCLAEKRSKEFYNAIFKTLQNYLSHKYAVSMGDINYERVASFIHGQRRNEILSDLKFIFDECDRVRYSSITATENDMQLVLNKLEKSLDNLEKNKNDENFFYKKMVIVFILFILLLSGTVHGWAQISETELNIKFSQGNEAYKNGQYDQAVEAYEEILKGSRESGPIYFNLGNSYFREGKLGKAILNYERSRQLMPRDSDLNFNLQYALNKIKQLEIKKPESLVDKFINRLINFYTLGEIGLIITLLVVLIGIVFILHIMTGFLKTSVSVLLSALIILVAVALTVLLVKIEEHKNVAIILKEVQAKFEPRKEATMHFDVFEGNKVAVMGEEEGWMKIKRFDGKMGWIENAAVEKINEH